MKKLILVIAFLAVSVGRMMAQTDDEYQLLWEANSLKEYSEGAVIGSVTAGFLERPTDRNAEVTALVRIRIENMAIEDAQNLKAIMSSGTAYIAKQEFHGSLDVPELWLFVSPESFSVVLYGDGYKSRPYDIERKLESRKIYSLTLRCVKQIAVSMAVIPQDVVMYVDGKRISDNKARLSSGRRKVSFSRNGRSMGRDTSIIVSEQNYNFQFDLRQRYSAHVTSDPADAEVYVRVDDKPVYYGRTPTTITLPEGSYQMITTYSKALSDTSVLNISPSQRNDKHIMLERKKKVELHAVYQGIRTAANLHIRRIDGRYVPDQNALVGARQSFSLNLPYGKYEVSMSNDKNTATRVIEVKENSGISYEFNIKPPKRSFVWPWQQDFNHRVVGVQAGWVSRQFTIGYSDGYSEPFNPVWGETLGPINGIRAGIHFQPLLWQGGLGVYFGAFFEYYFSHTPSSDRATTEDGTMAETYTDFSEKVVSVPLHLYYHIPFSSNLALVLHGGLDADIFFGAEYRDDNEVFLTYLPSYGTNNSWKRFNLYYSYAVGLQWGWAKLEAQWTNGITNNEMFADIAEIEGMDISTKWSKFNLSFSIMF